LFASNWRRNSNTAGVKYLVINRSFHPPVEHTPGNRQI
jgi:hypothetical protein